MTETLYKLQDLVNRLNATNSSNDKLDVLKLYSDDADIQKLLLYIYSPYKQYGVTSANCKKNGEIVNEHVRGVPISNACEEAIPHGAMPGKNYP